jgi:hypothetical protein
MPRIALVLCLVALTVAPTRAAGPPPAEQWLVVCAPAFREAIAPLVEHRKAQGLRVRVVQTTDVLAPRDLERRDASRLQAHLHRLCKAHSGRSSILLVGGIDAGGKLLPERSLLPPLPGTIGRMKGQPTDIGNGCLDGSRMPSVAVGRFPARTVEEAQAMVAKTLALERDKAPGRWRRQLTVLAGIPAYNAIVDRMVESVAFARFDRIHPVWTGRAVYTSAVSRFCVPDRLLRSQALEYLQEGQAVILYLGHSSAEGLYAGPTAAFLDRDDWGKLKIKTGGSLFITFGCNGCQLRGLDGEGYGVHSMRNPHGPVAVIGSHGICFAAMVQLAADGLFRRAFQGQPTRRLGDCWLAALEGVAMGKIDYLSYRMLDAVDGDPRIPQATQRQEHLEMFVLLGDPALRLPQVADDIELTVEKTITPGMTLRIAGRLPQRLREAKVTLSLERSPGSVPADLEELPALPPGARERIMLANHRRANRFAVVEKTVTARAGVFEARLEVPAKLPWPRLTLRVHALSAKDEALAVHPLQVKAP